MTDPRGRPAVSLVEVLVGLILVALLVLPIYQMIGRGATDSFRSRLALLAIHAAREEIEDVRVLARLQDGDPRRLEHDFRPVTGGPLDRLGPLAAQARLAPGGGRPYPADYGRIFTRLTIAPGPDPRIHRALLEVRWQEHGERPEAARVVDPLQRFEFLLVRSGRGGRARG